MASRGLFAVLAILAGPLSADDRVQSALEKARFTGGVVVHLGAGDASLLTALYQKRPNMLGHAVVADEETARAIREKLFDAKLNGKISAGPWDGSRLPFIDNFVNLLIAEEGTRVAREEILRALAPKGTALIGSEVVVKPRPATMDDWPQYLYDAQGNAVSKDKALKPPLGHIQWVGAPRWSRHHDKMSSVTACVSGDGKVFYIFDEGSTFTPYLPSRWKLIARDAFNGVLLWKLPISHWIGNLYGLKNGPATLPRRVIVEGNRVYATLGIEDPVSVIDAATGEILKTLPGTEGTEEIVCDNGTLFLVADKNPEKKEFEDFPRMAFPKGEWIVREKTVIRYDVGADKVAWSKPFDWVAPMTLASSQEKLFFFDGARVTALDAREGTETWRSDELPVFKNMPTFYAPRLVAQDDVVMFVGGEDYDGHNGSLGQLTGVSTKDGKTLWKATHPASGYRSPEDLFVIDGRAWAANVTAMSGTKNDPAKRTGDVIGFDLRSGNVGKTHPDVQAYWFHHRCYPAKATEDYLILSRTGVEFVNMDTGEWTPHHWVRGACLPGIVPANGLLYAPQHPCACYIGAKMFGFTALAPANKSHITRQPTPEANRLTTTEMINFLPTPTGDQESWPTYRSDTQRSGFVPGVGTPTRKTWSVKLSGPATQPVVADGKVVVANKDNPAVLAFSADTGNRIWRFLPGGRVDSSPTLYQGMVLFGASDGFIYCLDLSGGSLRWKFQAAPTRAHHMYLERLESTHPVHGSVLVMNDRVYAVAGRSMLTDGGMRFLILDAASGRKIHERVLDDKLPGTDKSLPMTHEILSMPVALPDILSSNGKKIFMRFQPFDLEGNRLEIPFSETMYGYKPEDYDRENEANLAKAKDQGGEDAHLFSGTGFLDDSWWHRTYWIYGKHHTSGHTGYHRAGASGAPAGRLITFDDDLIYTWGRMERFFKWSEEYVFHLHAKNRQYDTQWDTMVPIIVRAMVASDDSLFLLGPEELMRQHEAKPLITKPDVQEIMAKQERALQGELGSTLVIVDKKTGRIRSGLRLDGTPELDGMSGADGRLFVAMADGTVVCLGTSGDPLASLAQNNIDKLNAESKPPVFKEEGKEKGKQKGKAKQGKKGKT